MQVYCTSFCNKAHRVKDGKPVDHECYVLNPDALYLERWKGAQAVRDANIPIRTDRIHGGVQET